MALIMTKGSLMALMHWLRLVNLIDMSIRQFHSLNFVKPVHRARELSLVDIMSLVVLIHLTAMLSLMKLMAVRSLMSLMNLINLLIWLTLLRLVMHLVHHLAMDGRWR